MKLLMGSENLRADKSGSQAGRGLLGLATSAALGCVGLVTDLEELKLPRAWAWYGGRGFVPQPLEGRCL